MSRRPAARPADKAPGDDREQSSDQRFAALRDLPSVDELVRAMCAREGAATQPAIAHERAVAVAREALAEARQRIRAGADTTAPDLLTERALQLLRGEERPALRRVINATGVIVNTNLGRAPLSRAALEAMREAAQGYSNLEYDLDVGGRGSRQAHARKLLTHVTGADDALVVNNNAAAMLVVLSALAAGREVIVSRGELVEIGGGFRVPDVMRQGGARLVEVGTTNRTRLRDYEAAIGPDTALLLAVHPSNFRVVGFTEAPKLTELAELAHERGLPLVHDVGSGCLLPTERWGLAHEPTPQESIAAGADVVCFSGDKLLGGPQAGIIAGRRDLLANIEKHPLMRAVRIDKLTLAALEATLRLHRNGQAEHDIPVWRAIATPLSAIRVRAEAWAAWLRERGMAASVVAGDSTIGGGSLPGETLPTALCVITLRDGQGEAEEIGELARRLRTGEPAVVGRVSRDQLLLDPRTVLPEEDTELLQRVVKAAIPADEIC